MSATEQAFYVTGGTLRSDAPSYVERACSLATLVALDRDLHAALTRGEFCYVLTSRRGTHEVGRGKSSLPHPEAGRPPASKRVGGARSAGPGPGRSAPPPASAMRCCAIMPEGAPLDPDCRGWRVSKADCDRLKLYPRKGNNG
jgi:hypothetical protein